MMAKRMMAAKLQLLVVLFALFVTAFSDQKMDLSELLQRVNNLEDEVTLLDARLDKLESQSTGATNNEVKMDFKILNMSKEYDEENSLFHFTMLYEAEKQPELLLEFSNSADPPVKIAHNTMGKAQFSVPITEVSPTLLVYPQRSTLFYSLVLIASGGPPPAPNMSNIAMTTFPGNSIAFSHHDEPQITLTSRIVGDRRVKEEAAGFMIITLDDGKVQYHPLHEFPAKGNDVSIEGDVSSPDDVMHDPDATGAAGHRLRLVEHGKEGDNITYNFKLNTSGEDRGFLYLYHRVSFDCTGGCVLYEATVSKLMRYYREDVYQVSGPLGVPYGKGPASSEDGRFVSYVGDEIATVTCHENETCQLGCEVFGDDPTVRFPTNLDQPMKDYREFSVKTAEFHPIYYSAFAYVVFDAVPREAAGMYACIAETGDGSATNVKMITLDVV